MANWATTAALGDPSSEEWQNANLQWIEPVKGQRWQVYKQAAPQFEGLLKDLMAIGYTPTSSGGYNYRNIRGSDKLSQHAFGTAIDMNALTNALGQSATDIPDAAELAKKWGLEWGGNWENRPDPMHFEFTGVGADGKPLPLPAAQQPPMALAGIGSPDTPATPPETQPGPAPLVASAAKQAPLGQRLGDAMLDFGGKIGGSAKPFTYQAPQQPAAALVAEAATPTINRQQNEVQRNQLAQALARLNQGRLVV